MTLEYADAASDSVKFRSPMDIPITLAGTFCEMRGSHFHAGIDIRTNGREGLPVYSIEAGHVSRIKISKTGYGKAIYIDHPGGFTSVYAHLQKFSDRIEQRIRKVQYTKESFEVDEYFPAGTIILEKGELIGLSGNSGRSFAPHLHFEIRDTRTEHPLNPLAYLDPISDNAEPVMSDLLLYKADESRGRIVSKREKIIRKTTGHSLLSDTITVGFQKAGLGINTYDANGAGGKNGVYELIARVNGKIYYRFAMDRLSFDETRYALAQCDYRLNERDKIKVHRLYRLPGNYFSFYDQMLDDGMLMLSKDSVSRISITARDFNGNSSNLSFALRYDPALPGPDFSTIAYDTIFDFRSDNLFVSDEVKVFLPKNTCYDSLFFNYEKLSYKTGKTISAVHKIHTTEEPAHLNFTVFIKPDLVPVGLKSKALIVRETPDNKLESKESIWEDDWIKCKTRDFGKYYVLLDTVPPKIEPVNIFNNKTMTATATIQLKVKDEVAGLKNYRGEVDGKWVLMEYDEKNDLLTYFFDWRTEPGEHNFVLTVSDAVGNDSRYEAKFRR